MDGAGGKGPMRARQSERSRIGLQIWSWAVTIRFSHTSTRATGAALQTHPFPISKQIGTAMTQVKSGDTVRVHYTGTLTDGQTFDSSEGRDPLEFQVGSGQIIPGLDAAVEGMAVGEKKTVEVPADQAYGQPDPNAQQAVPRAEIPEDIPLDLGTQLQVQTPQGQVMPVTVVEVTEEQVVLDANHPLAGKDLTFAIELVDIT